MDPPVSDLPAMGIDFLPSRYNTAKKLKESQDNYCTKVTAGKFEDLGEFPEDLAWEPLSEVLRGRMKVSWVILCVHGSLIHFRSKFIATKLRIWMVSRGYAGKGFPTSCES